MNMQSIYQKISKGLGTGLFAMFVVAAVAVPQAHAALSGQAGNTVIRNTVTVNYKDATNVAQTAVTAGVDVSVTTVDALPSIVSISPASGISTTATGDTYSYTVDVRTNSNGPGTIALTANADVAATGNLTVGVAPSFASANLFLGSTTFDPTDTNIGVATTVPAAGTITIAVPNDGGVPTDAAATGGATGDGVINGLVANDVVYITDGTTFTGPFTVTTVTDPALGVNAIAAPASLVLTNNTAGAFTAFTPAAGWMIVESKTTTMTVTQGTLTDPTISTNYTSTVLLAMGGVGPTASATTVITTATSSKLSVAKYVRNVTAGVVGTGATTITINGIK